MDNPVRVQVFVSCPQDVEKEKEAIISICKRFSDDYQLEKYDVEYKVRDWREIIGNIGELPQVTIDEQISEYDIYIGILWKKFGTPPGTFNPDTQEPFGSGTEHEFFYALEKWKRDPKSVQLYFFFKKPDEVGQLHDQEQLRQVEEFRKKLELQRNWIHEFSSNQEFTEAVSSIVNRYFLNLIRQQQVYTKKMAVEETGSNASFPPMVDLSSFMKGVKVGEVHIPRSIKEYRVINQKHNVFIQEHESVVQLVEVVASKQCVVVLGGAGSGKSVELQQLALSHVGEASPLVPLYKRLNTYTDEKLEDFLPAGWEKVEKSLLLILDGLDEVQPAHFNTAIRRLTSFAESHPTVKMVVSSRTNFYELPTKEASGTLPGFDVYTLTDISRNDVRQFVESKYEIDGKEFIKVVEGRGLLDLLQRPFFLKILAETYATTGNLKGSRADIFSKFIESRISLDKEHFKTTVPLRHKKTDILKLLERVAFVMEALGQNVLAGDDILAIVGSEESFILLKYCTAFNKQSDDSETWSFEHNNIQEYLAARALSSLQVEEIKEKISFKPGYIKVKPTWVNTLSFLVSIIEGQPLKELTNWLVENDPEIVVKFEPDRLQEAVRVEIFQKIFNFYKEKGIWLSSNKFENNELARFSQSAATITFLVEQLTNHANPRVTVLNALSVLKHSELNFRNKQTVKDALMGVLDRWGSDHGLVHAVLQTLTKLNFHKQDVVRAVVSKFREYRNQHVRAGLYKLINSAALVDQHVDLYLIGVTLLDSKDYPGEREAVTFWDEEFCLQEGLNLLKSTQAVKKFILFFQKPFGSRQRRYLNKKEIFRIMVRQAIEAYAADKSVLEDMLTLYHAYGKIYERDYSLIIATFFQETGTQVDAFNSTWDHEELDLVEKDFLVAPLVNRQVLNRYVADYIERNRTSADTRELHRILKRNFATDPENLHLIEFFETRVNAASGEEVLISTPPIDYNARERERMQQNFDLLFNKPGFISEVAKVFEKLEMDTLNFEDLWEYKNQTNRYIDQDFAKSPLDLLRDFTRGDMSVGKAQIRSWLRRGRNYERLQVREVYSYLKNYDYLIVSPKQRSWIASWTDQTLQDTDLKQAVTVRNDDRDSVSVSIEAIWCWYFIQRLDLKLEQDKALDFTLFTNFENTGDNQLFIATLEKYAEKSELEERVTQNLNEGIASNLVWENNALYAIDNQIESAYDSILHELLHSTRPDYTRARLLKKLHEAVQDDSLLVELLQSAEDDKIRWTMVDLLMANAGKHEQLSTYLLHLLREQGKVVDQKLNASKYLIMLNQLEGLSYYVRYVKQHQDVYFEYHNLHFLHHLTNPAAIPGLIELYSLGKDPDFPQDEFNRLDYEAINALYTMGMVSEENLQLVKDALMEFIEEKKDEIKDLNFLYHTLDKMEHQFYVSKSQEYSLADAIQEAEGI